MYSRHWLFTKNRLVSTERDFEPISGIPRQNAIPVSIRPLTAAELAAITTREPTLRGVGATP